MTSSKIPKINNPNSHQEIIPRSQIDSDYVIILLERFGLPLTRENYLGLAYPEGLPEDFDETTLPLQIRKAS